MVDISSELFEESTINLYLSTSASLPEDACILFASCDDEAIAYHAISQGDSLTIEILSSQRPMRIPNRLVLRGARRP